MIHSAVENGSKVETVRYSPVQLVGQDSTKSVYKYGTMSSLLQFTVALELKYYALAKPQKKYHV